MATDSVNCNLKEKKIYECFKELDKVYFFKKRKYNKCLNLQKEFQNCLLYSNQISLNKRQNYKSEINSIEIEEKYKNLKNENMQDAINFIEGKLTEEEILKKPENPKIRKKIIEL